MGVVRDSPQVALAVSVQVDLFGKEPVVEQEETPPAGWGRQREVELVEPYEEIPWGAWVLTPERLEQQLARFLDRSTAYRAFRCIVCRCAVVVDLEQWRNGHAQIARCPYSRCGGWVQRDSERIGAEETWQSAETAVTRESSCAASASTANVAALVGFPSTRTSGLQSGRRKGEEHEAGDHPGGVAGDLDESEDQGCGAAGWFRWMVDRESRGGLDEAPEPPDPRDYY